MRKKTSIIVLVVLFALLAFSTGAFAEVAKLVLKSPAGSAIGSQFNITLYIGSGTTALGTYASTVPAETNAQQAVWNINSAGVYNYRTTTVSGQSHYAVTKLLFIPQDQVAGDAVIELEIETGRQGTGWDASSSGTVPSDQLMKEGGKLSAPANSAVYQTPRWTKPGYGRYQTTNQDDLMEFVQEIAAKSPKAHLFLLNENIDPASGVPFGKTLQFAYDIPIVIVTNTPIPANATFDQAAKLIRESGKPTFFHQGQIHGNEHSAGEGAMAMLFEMVGAYGEMYLDKVNYVCVPRYNVEGGRNNARSSVNPSIDMNRDHLRMRAPEVRMVHYAYLAIMPEVAQDGHELGGYSAGTHANSQTRQPGVTAQGITLNHDIESTPSTSMNNPSMPLVDHALNLYMSNMFGRLLSKDIFIDHYEGGSNGWTANNSIGRAWMGLMGSVSVLVETRGQNVGNNIARRAYSQLEAAKSLLETLYHNADETQRLVAEARANAVTMGRTYDASRLIYLNQSASGNTTAFRNSGNEVAGARYTPYKGAARTLDLIGNEMTPTGSSAANVTKALALNDTSSRNRPRPTAYVIPKGITRSTLPGVTTVTATNGYAINYDYIISSMKWNNIHYYEIAPGTTATVRQYFRSDTGNGTTSVTADIRAAASVTFTDGAYVIPLDQEAGAVVVATFEPDITNANSYNASVAQSLSGTEGYALIFHDITTRNYPYYRFEGDNPRVAFQNIHAPTSVTLNKTSTSLLIGRSEMLIATVLPATSENKDVTWRTDNPLVATVSATGLVSAVGAGSAYITARTVDGGFEASCYVYVTTPVSSITITPSVISLDAGDTYWFYSTVEPFNASNSALVWTTSDPAIATVNPVGIVTAVGGGRATITATAADGSGVFATAIVNVPPVLVTGVTLNKSFLQLLVGGSETLIATVTPANATNKDIIWSCDSPYVATVDQNGLVTGIGGGPAIITAKTVDGGFEAICNVHVSIPVSSITISPAAVSIDVDEIYWLTATVEPFNAGNVALTWSSSNTAVATVTAVGFVRGIAPGTVTITAAAQDGSGVTATATVTVLDPYVPVTGVSLNRTYYLFTSVGATMQLTPIFTPSNATDQTVTWTSGTPGVATVSATGLVTAVSAGNAAITVMTNDGGFTTACNIFVQIGGGADPSDDITPERPVLPPGTPGGIVSSEPIIIIPADSTDISLEADMLATILPGFSSEDFHVNEYGVITLQDWIAMEISKSTLNIFDAEVEMLPVFEAIISNPGEIAAVSFNVKGYHLMVDGLITRAENVRLMMALSSTSGDFFTFTSVPANFDDKMFTILDASNNIFTGEIDPNGDYKVLCFIRDGGDFDLDGQVDGAVWGVMAFVSVPALGVTLSPDHVMLQIGQTFDFSPGVDYLPPIADNKRITWSSDNLAVATISPAGVVTAVGGGSANITVTTIDNRFSATSTVSVSTPVTSVTIMPPTATISVGGMDMLSVTVLPFNATNPNVVWSSSNDAVATVTQAGIVRGVTAGAVTITATAQDGSGVFGTCAVTIVP